MFISTFLVLLALIGHHSAYGLQKNLHFKLKRWEFLTKFAFFAQKGKITATSQFEKKTYRTSDTTYLIGFNVTPQLKFASNDEISWKRIYSHYENTVTEKDCNNFMNNLTGHVEEFGKDKLEHADAHVTIKLNNVDIEYGGKNTYHFFILFTCSNNATIDTTINITLTNGERGDIFRYQLSADHFYVLESLIGLVIFIFIFLGLLVIYIREVKKAERSSILTILFMLVVVVKVVVYLGELIIMLVYATEGIFNFQIFMIFELLNVISTMLFAEIILSLSFGLTVVCGSLSMPLTLILIIIGMAYFLLATFSIIINAVKFDDAYLLYLYNDSPGYIICIIHFIIAILVAVGSIRMLIKYPTRRNFYAIFFPLSLLWIFVTPVLILISTSSFIAYLRFSLIAIARNLADSLAHFIYMIITYPKLCPQIIIYTTPAHVIAPITFDEAMSAAAEDLPKTLEDNNRNFMNLSEFQSDE